jgi:hypothetical protein
MRERNFPPVFHVSQAFFLIFLILFHRLSRLLTLLHFSRLICTALWIARWWHRRCVAQVVDSVYGQLQICVAMPANASLTRKHAADVRVAKRKKAVHTTVKRRKAKRERAAQAMKKKHELTPPLSAQMIFANERRPAIVAAIRAKGDHVSSSEVDMQITALWFAEADKARYRALEDKDRERYADDKATLHWEGGVPRKRTAAPQNRAASFEDAAQTPPVHDAVPLQWASVSPAAASVYCYAVGYLQPFVVLADGTWVDPKMARHKRTQWASLQLIAVGCGPLRAPTCSHMLQVASGETATGQALLRRALLLVGDLQRLELRPPGATQGTCDFIQSMLEQETAEFFLKPDGGTARDAPVSKALTSLRVVKGNQMSLRATLIQQCAATLTELECYGLDDDAVIPHCRRLESLTFLDIFWTCPPTAWLGLSQLHTLRGVSLCAVSAAAIAAALPRLHTLHLHNGRGEFSVDEFFDQLLPRLRSFHLEGWWPTTEEPENAAAPPLPLLEDLKWYASSMDLPHQLMGARPSTLNTSDAVLFEWLQAADGAGTDSVTAVTSPLARVRALTLRIDRTRPEAAFMARLLREAPLLRRWTFHAYDREDVLWGMSEFTSKSAFAGLAHPKLRRIAVTSLYFQARGPAPSDCGVRLRQHHFPRLRRLTVDDLEYPV